MSKSSNFLSRLCWVMGCSNLAMSQMVGLTFKDEKGKYRKAFGFDRSQIKLLDDAQFYQKTNSLILALLGLNTCFLSNRLAHFAAFSLFTNALLF